MEAFVDVHREQLAAIGFPPELNGRLYEKLTKEDFQSGGHFQVVEEEETGTRFVKCVADLEANGDVFLVDHAWTFDVETYRKELDQRPELLERLATMMGCRQEEGEDEAEEQQVDGEGAGTDGEAGEEEVEVDEEALPRAKADGRKTVYAQVCEEVWRYAQPYRLVEPRDPLRFKTLWFVNDELGSALSHSDRANTKLAPFVYMPDGTLRSAMSYSLLWPTQRVEEGELCTRDFAAGVHYSQRLARLALWFNLPPRVMQQFRRKHEAWARKHRDPEPSPTASPTKDGPIKIKKADHFTNKFPRRVRAGHRLKIYSDNAQIIEHLTRPEFEHTDDPSEADICWVYHSAITDNYRQEHKLRADAILGQSPGDECLVFKHLLPGTAARAKGSWQWIPQTWNLETEAAEVVYEVMKRRREGKEHWFILKPWNMGRSMDSVVADSLAQVLRYMETGPKVCCDYVATPALAWGRKVDLRIRVVVRCWRPLELVRWTHVGCRLANKPYTMDPKELGDFQTHFTVMDYAGHRVEVPSEVEFLAAFEKENGAPFSVVDRKIDAMLKELFTAAADVMIEKHGAGNELDLCASTYGVDVIVTSDLEIRLLEVTFAPDCHRALGEDPDYYNKAFGAMFLNESADFALL